MVSASEERPKPADRPKWALRVRFVEPVQQLHNWGRNNADALDSESLPRVSCVPFTQERPQLANRELEALA